MSVRGVFSYLVSFHLPFGAVPLLFGNTPILCSLQRYCLPKIVPFDTCGRSGLEPFLSWVISQISPRRVHLFFFGPFQDRSFPRLSFFFPLTLFPSSGPGFDIFLLSYCARGPISYPLLFVHVLVASSTKRSLPSLFPLDSSKSTIHPCLPRFRSDCPIHP